MILQDAADPEAAAADLARTRGLAVMRVFRRAVKGFSALIPPGRVAAVRADPRVKAVGEDRTIHKSAQTLPMNIDRVDAEPGAAGGDGTGAHAAVIDTGIDRAHPDLAANVAGGVTLVTSQAGTTEGGQDDDGHGTHVAGTIAAVDDAEGVVGVGPRIKLWAVKVLGSDGSGSFSDVIAGVDWVMDETAHPKIAVANMSLGATCSVCTEDSTDPTLQALRAAIQNAVAAGITFTVAAGNEAADAKFSVPAAYDEVITVSAHTDTDGRPGGQGPSLVFPGLGKFDDDSFAKFSNFGADVDLTAPGVSVLSTKLGGGTVSYSGTSMAAPHAAGAAALVAAANPGATPAEIRSALVGTGECADGAEAGAGGCARSWPKDPDGIPEPLLNAARASRWSRPQPSVLLTVSPEKANYFAGQDSQAALTAALKDEAGAPITGLSAAAFSSTLDGAAVSLGYAETAVPGAYAAALPLGGLSLGNHALATTATDARGIAGSGTAAFNLVEPGPTMHVESVAVSLLKKGPNWRGSAQVAIRDANGSPVAGAAVRVEWTLNGAFLSVADALSGAEGLASSESKSARTKPGDTFTATVLSVTKDGSAYDPAQNSASSGSATVP